MSGERAGPVEHHIQVTRTARYWTLGDPRAEDVWVVIHGYKQLARRFLRRFEPIASPGRLIVAPEALSRFYASAETGRHGPASIVGASWMTREDRLVEIRDYVAYLDRLLEALPLDGRRLTVLGFSQGVATASRWAATTRPPPARLVCWGGLVPEEIPAARLADIRLTYVVGEQEEWAPLPAVEAQAASFRGAGGTVDVVRFDGGHEIRSDVVSRLSL